jgi:ribonucleoside-diphosphate reductase alpha chain
MNKDNLTPKLLRYVASAPCGEVGLAPGEACLFSSINIAAFYRDHAIDFDELRTVIHTTTRFLDDMLEYSIQHYGNEEVKKVMQLKRKI